MSPTAETWYWARRWASFRQGSRQIRVAWPEGSAGARLYDQGAPRTAGALLGMLPLEIPVVHVAWSGDMVMSVRPYELGHDEGLENEVRLVQPGDLSWDPKSGELAFTYGSAECRLPSGPNTVTVYGQVTEGLEALAAYCAARRFEGVGTIVLEAANDSIAGG